MITTAINRNTSYTDMADGNSLGTFSYDTKWHLFSFVIGSDVDLSDITIIKYCVANHACLHCQGLFTEVLSIYISDNISGKRHIKSTR